MAKGFSIGAVRVEGRLALAPLADINKPSFRLLCKEKGASLVYTEMINAEGLLRQGHESVELSKTLSRERPVALQLFGHKPSAFARAAQIVGGKADIIDINAGCYVHRVTRHGAGCALMKDPRLLGEIVKVVVDVAGVPVTVKMRIGFSKKDRNFLECATQAERAGASAIALHARTADMGYSGAADWDAIRQLKQAVSVPVIGNGDVRGPQDCKRMIDETGCDAVMIGRAAVGNPDVFSRCQRFLEDGTVLPEQTSKERVKDYRRLLLLHWKYDGMEREGHSDVAFARSQAMSFTTGLAGGSDMRVKISKARGDKDIVRILSERSHSEEPHLP